MKTSVVVPLVVLLSLLAVVTLAQPVVPGGRGKILSSEAMALQTSADLVPRDVGLSGLGEIVFTLQNRGDMNINADRFTMASKNLTTPPITIDLYINSVKVQSHYLPSFGAKETRVVTVTLPPNQRPKCKESRAIKVVVDPANTIKELRDDNNVASITVARPCPDLAIKNIDRAAEGVANSMYRVRVTVINQGNAPAPASQAWAASLSSAPGITGWPELIPVQTIPALAPGQTYTFKSGGSVFSFDNSWIKVFLDRDRKIDELDESNNFLDKKV